MLCFWGGVADFGQCHLDKLRLASLVKLMAKKILYTGKWLALGEVEAVNKEGGAYTWEFATRTGTTNGAVCVIAIKRGAEPSLILVKQFRPPIQAEILELPAGLIEDGQTREEAALRELREETGYVGKVLSVGPPIFNTPGMTDEHVASVIVEVGEQFEQQTEVNEDIEVLEIPIRHLKRELSELERSGLRMDAKLWSIAEGLELSVLV